MKIIVFPKMKSPDQELLSQAMHDDGDTIAYYHGPSFSVVLNLLCMPWVLVVRRLRGYRVFHLYRPESFVVEWAGMPGRMLSQLYFMLVVKWLRLLGYKLVWTLNDVLPLSQFFYDDLIAARFLSQKAHAKIVYSRAVMKQMEFAGLTTERTHVLPHGGYGARAIKEVAAAKARSFLHLPSDAFVFMIVGDLRTHKGIESLVGAFDRLLQSEPKRDVRLVLAGTVYGEQLHQFLLASQQRMHEQLIVHNQRITNKELPFYLAAADVVTVPYAHASLNADAMLALTFGVPILAPRQGSLAELPEEVGFWYDPASPEGLYGALKKVSATRGRARRAKAARAFAQELSWSQAAAQLSRLYRTL